MIVRLPPVLFCLGLLVSCAPALAAPEPYCFARALPAGLRDTGLDDVKLLLGWVFDVAAAHQALSAGEVIDYSSGLTEVPGFGGITDLRALRGRYRVIRPPFDAGTGYYGVELASLDEQDNPTAFFLLNRLFRLPVLLQDPLGVASDIVTNGALLFGGRTEAVAAMESAADTVLADAAEAGVPLLAVGQSQAGGEAQLQAAYLTKAHPGRADRAGFVTFNAARANISVRRLGLALDAVPGINFAKDLDPGFGPHGLLPNDIGLQVHIHPDGSGGGLAGDQSFLTALVHPGEHFLNRFNVVSLAAALRNSLAALPDRCAPALAAPPAMD